MHNLSKKSGKSEEKLLVVSIGKVKTVMQELQNNLLELGKKIEANNVEEKNHMVNDKILRYSKNKYIIKVEKK